MMCKIIVVLFVYLLISCLYIVSIVSHPMSKMNSQGLGQIESNEVLLTFYLHVALSKLRVETIKEANLFPRT